MKPKKLAFVANSSWSVLRFRKQVLQHFLARGFEVFVFTPYDKTADELVSLGCRHQHVVLSRKGLNPLMDLLTLLNLLWYYIKHKPDFIFHYTIKPNIWGSVAAKIANVRSAAITTGLGYVFVERNFLTKFVSILYRLSLRCSEVVCFLNEDDKNEFVSEEIIPESKAKVFPGEGIDLAEFEFSASFPSVPTFLMVSRLLRDKGVLEFVKAAEMVKKFFPHASFQLLGPIDVGNPSSVSREQLREWEGAGYIQYLGVLEDVRPAVLNCTAVVLPSYYREGVPRVLLEGGAMGRVLITTNMPGCRSVVTGVEDGFLVTPKNMVELAEAMLAVCRSSQERIAKFATESRKRIESEFGIDRVLENYEAVLASAEADLVGAGG